MASLIFLPIQAIDDPSSNQSLLIDWFASQISDPSDRLDVPLRIKNVLRSNQSFSNLIPFLKQSIYRLNSFVNNKEENIVELINKINLISNNLNSIYLLFKFSNDEIILLKRSEYSIYQKMILLDWEKIVQLYNSNYPNLLFISTILIKINLNEKLTELVLDIAKFKIFNKINSKFGLTPILSLLIEWVKSELYPSLNKLIIQPNFYNCLLKILKNQLILKRTDQIFELIDDYPISRLTLIELNVCLTNSNQKNLLISNFLEEINKKLLIPSINTTDIILFYIKTIHSFILIDHRGVLLDKVARNIRNYLKVRNDSIEKIVNSLLDNSKTNKLNELTIELKNSNKSMEKNFANKDLSWQPDPIDALPDFKIGKIDDIIDSLISIFDNNKLFINQFVKIFSIDLLNILNYDINKINENLLLLKLKFGNDFNKIDIMLNDITESEIIDELINKPNIHGKFLSHLYWSNISDYKFNISPFINEQLHEYKESFESIKKGRILKLHPHQVKVKIELEINDVNKRFIVSLDKLSILEFFNDNTNNTSGIKLGLVVMKLSMPLQLAKNAIEFWVDEGVLVETGGGWKLNE